MESGQQGSKLSTFRTDFVPLVYPHRHRTLKKSGLIMFRFCCNDLRLGFSGCDTQTIETNPRRCFTCFLTLPDYRSRRICLNSSGFVDLSAFCVECSFSNFERIRRRRFLPLPKGSSSDESNPKGPQHGGSQKNRFNSSLGKATKSSTN